MEIMRKHFWHLLALLLAIAFGVTAANNHYLREQNKLLLEINGLQRKWCTGADKVNELCEHVLLDLLVRLGLDDQMMPLITTVYWRRLTNDYPISTAREKLGAKEMADGVLDAATAIGGDDTDGCVE